MSESSLFSSYVTSTAFSLSLSRPQVRMLCDLDYWGPRIFAHLNTASALVGKGLVERIPPAEVDLLPESERVWAAQQFRLTEAGRAVIPLLKLAGMYLERPELPPVAETLEPEIRLRVKVEVTE